MKPLLAHIYEPKRFTPGWVQPKLNGIRALYQAGHFQSRDELPWNEEILKHLSEPLKNVFDPDVILDGELYVHGWKLQDINAAIAVNRGRPTEKSHLVEYHVFDRISYQQNFGARFNPIKATLWSLRCDNFLVKPVETFFVKYQSDADAHYARFIHEGYEGIMYRLGDCPYTRPKEPNIHYPNLSLKFLSDKNNRCWHLLKRKDWQDAEFICLGVEEGQGKRANRVGRFIFETANGVRWGAGSGLSDEEASFFFRNPPIGQRVKIKFLCYTRDQIPFNPTIEAIL